MTKIYQSPVADSIPFDNTTNSFVSDNVQEAIEEVRSPPNGGTGVTPPFLFSRQGGMGLNSYLQVGNVFSNQAGQIIPGNNKIVKITVTTSQVYNIAPVIQFQTRTGLSTRVDIAGASITIPGNNTDYSATYVLPSPVTIGPNAEVSCYLKSGNNITNPVVLLFVVPL